MSEKCNNNKKRTLRIVNLEAQVIALRELVHFAYEEGYRDGCDDWQRSETKKSLDKHREDNHELTRP